MQDIYAKAAQIKLVIFDVDGVLTDGKLTIGDDGQEYKAFHSRDGHGMKMLQQCGVEIGVITGRTSRVVEHRMQNLGVLHVYQGQADKRPAYQEMITKLNVRASEDAYVGDDVVDLPIMVLVGLSIAVADAHSLVKEHAHWVTSHAGGCGAAREVCELIMRAQNQFAPAIAKYLTR